MAEQRFTLIIVPHDAPGVRKLQITAKSLLYVLIGFGVLLAASIGMTIHHVKLYRDAQIYANLQKENVELKASLEQSQVLTQKLNKKISFLTDISNKLKVMAGLPEGPLNRKKNAQLQPGIGGITMDDHSSGTADRLFGLQKRAEYLEQTFALLNNYFHNKSQEFSTTPSVLPAQGFLSSSFGSRHNPFTNAPDFHEGIDITNEIGTPVVAPASGVVSFAGIKGNYGNVIEIQHDNGISTLYGHLSRIRVKLGQRVNRWDVIGEIGNTGHSTGPHLHYEVHVSDQPVNPIPYILDLDSLG